MNKTIFFTVWFHLFALHAVAQFGETERITLQRLGVKSVSLDLVMRDISSFMAEKPNGLQFPVTKIVFSQLDDLLCFEIIGVDNSWKELFKFGEMPFGYVVVQNRLFIIVKQGYHKVDIDNLFFPVDETKSFNKNSLNTLVVERWPVWFFEYRDDEAYLISVSDLDILDEEDY